jgi:hypothetical protein
LLRDVDFTLASSTSDGTGPHLSIFVEDDSEAEETPGSQVEGGAAASAGQPAASSGGSSKPKVRTSNEVVRLLRDKFPEVILTPGSKYRPPFRTLRAIFDCLWEVCDIKKGPRINYVVALNPITPWATAANQFVLPLTLS